MKFNALSVATVIAALLLATTAWATQTPPVRPNIVFILIDDAGFSDFGSYGSEIETPNIDQIAKTGVRFTNFHTASTCESSRSMMHTGIDHHRAGAGTLKVVLAENQKGKPGYEGYLSDAAYSLGQLMHDGGYATYFAGKWNLGDGVERSPGAKGWDRYISLEQTGADNYEAKVYAPLNMEAVWWEDGRRAKLPENFFSTRHYVDKMIQFIDEGKAANKPFFSIIAFQAVHSPLQAPEVDINKYRHRYDAGWETIRSQRYQRQIQMGLIPDGLKLPRSVLAKTWADLSTRDQLLYAKKMAVFAGMLDNADQHIGRFRDHLKQIGQLDNTVFIVMSDNGADPYELNNLSLPFKLWYRVNFALGIDTLGQRGSYVHYGQDWAEVSNTPFAMFKGTSGEGGMRVPFIVNFPHHIKAGSITNQFAYMTDFFPTVLDIAGIAVPGTDYKGKKFIPPTGKSLMPFLEGETPAIHAANEAFGFEGTGSEALLKGDYKIERNGPPYGDGRWHLYNLRINPLESVDLASAEPAIFSQLRSDYASYLKNNGVILPPADYSAVQQVLINNWPVLMYQMKWVIAGAIACLLTALVLLTYGIQNYRRKKSKVRFAART